MTINPDGRQSVGALSGSREPDPSFTGSGPSGFDPERGEIFCAQCSEWVVHDDGLCRDCFDEINGQFGVGA